MGCFGNSGAAAQREADHLALINRYKAENTSLKADVARLEREMAELRSQSADAVRQKEEEAAMEEVMEVVCGRDGMSSDSGMMLSQGFEQNNTGLHTPSPVSTQSNGA